MADAPSATPRAKPPSNVGCVVAVVALPVVVFLGLIVGTALRGDDEPDEQHVTLEEGELDGVQWTVDAVLDVEGETCIFLYEEGAEDPLNGTCDLQPQDVSYGDQTIVFGRADADASTVTVDLSTTDTVDIATVPVEGMAGRFYVDIVGGDVDAVALIG